MTPPATEARFLARRLRAARRGTFNTTRLAQLERKLNRVRRDRYGFVELPYFLAEYRLCIDHDCASAARYRDVSLARAEAAYALVGVGERRAA